MNIEEFRDYCLQKPAVTEGFPFDDKILVFKVCGKMFALTNIEAFVSINLKCDPERAVLLREKYAEVQPGYHMSKVHWNTVSITGALEKSLLLELIDHSYKLVVSKLSKKEKALLNQ